MTHSSAIEVANTQLLRAALDGTLEHVKAAVASGGEIEVRNRKGEGLLSLAAHYNRRPEVSQYLIDQGLDLFEENGDLQLPLHGYARAGHLDLIRHCIAAGVPVDSRDKRGDTPLIFAAVEGRADALESLIKGGAKPICAGDGHYTALHLTHSLDCARVLLDAGIPIDCATADGKTPLMVHALRGRNALGRLLLSEGAKLNATCRDGWTALLYAARGDDAAMVLLLLGAGADPNVVSSDDKDLAFFCDRKPDVAAAYGAWKARQGMRAAIRPRPVTER